MLSAYYSLTKPGIVYGNALTAAAGFFVAAHGSPDFRLLLAMLVGLSLVVASGCVFNNYIDRDIDALMERTKYRELVRGTIGLGSALGYGTILGILGAAVLVLYTNLLTALIAFLGFVVYVGCYSILAKRHSLYATHIGSIAGAVPPVVGYCAVTNTLDLGALLLFLILCLWQMPHFFAIALYRNDEYAAAGIPTLPIVKGERSAKTHITLYIGAFLAATLALAYFGYAGTAYAVTAVVFGLAWLGIALAGFRASDGRRWARRVFFSSLIVLTVLCVAMSADARAPAAHTVLPNDGGLS